MASPSLILTQILMLVVTSPCTHVHLHTLPPSQYATPEERVLRFRAFKDGLKDIDALNAAEKVKYGTTSHVLNRLADSNADC